MTGYRICILAVFVIFDAVQFSSGTLSERERTKIDTLVTKLQKCHNVPGMILSVVQNGQKAYTKGYGVKDIENNIPVTTDTKFCVGSITKSFTALLLAKLLSDSNGSVSWDTPIKEIIADPTWRLCDDLRTNSVNIRDLLAQRAGIPRYDGGWLMFNHANMSREDVIRRLKFLPSNMEFRDGFRFNNYMYILAGYVAEKLGRKSWEALIEELLLQPLGMNDTITGDKLMDTPDLSKSYVLENGHHVEINRKVFDALKFIGPSGAICSTADDMAQYLSFQVMHGKLKDGTQHISKSYFHDLHISSNHLPGDLIVFVKPYFPKSMVAQSYGMGLAFPLYNGYRMGAHPGNILGFDSFLSFLPDVKLGVFTSVNGGGSPSMHYMIHTYIADLLTPGETPWVEENWPCNLTQPAGEPVIEDIPSGRIPFSLEPDLNLESKLTGFEVSRPSRPLESYTGSFEHGMFGILRVYKNETDGLLHLKNDPYGHLRLLPTREADAFLAEDLGTLASLFKQVHRDVTFMSSSDSGVVDQVSITALDPDMPPVWTRKSNGRDPIRHTPERTYSPYQTEQ